MQLFTFICNPGTEILTATHPYRKLRDHIMEKTTGEQVAVKKDSLQVGGLITGADMHTGKGRIVLTGYSLSTGRFIYLLYDFPGTNFFSGNKRKIMLNGFFQMNDK
jgi:hypothetical protein